MANQFTQLRFFLLLDEDEWNNADDVADTNEEGSF